MTEKVQFCSQCGSTRIKERGMIAQKAYSNLKVCQSCGFQGPLFPEATPEEYVNIAKTNHVQEKQHVQFNPSAMPAVADGFTWTPAKRIIATIIVILFVISISWTIIMMIKG